MDTMMYYRVITFSMYCIGCMYIYIWGKMQLLGALEPYKTRNAVETFNLFKFFLGWTNLSFWGY